VDVENKLKLAEEIQVGGISGGIAITGKANTPTGFELVEYEPD
jgi:hypothetical protein